MCITNHQLVFLTVEGCDLDLVPNYTLKVVFYDFEMKGKESRRPAILFCALSTYCSDILSSKSVSQLRATFTQRTEDKKERSPILLKKKAKGWL